MMLADLTSTEITGKDAETFLGKAGITVNKNFIPFDTRPPHITSGIRIGTPAITSRGMKTDEMIQVADFIADVLENPNDDVIKKIKGRVENLCREFPIYPDMEQ